MLMYQTGVGDEKKACCSKNKFSVSAEPGLRQQETEKKKPAVIVIEERANYWELWLLKHLK